MNALLLLAYAGMPTVQLTPESACRRYGYADHRNQQVLLLFGFDLCCHLDVNKYIIRL